MERLGWEGEGMDVVRHALRITHYALRTTPDDDARARARLPRTPHPLLPSTATVPCFVPRSPVGFVRALAVRGHQGGGAPWEASADLSIFPGRASRLALPCGREPPPSSTSGGRTVDDRRWTIALGFLTIVHRLWSIVLFPRSPGACVPLRFG